MDESVVADQQELRQICTDTGCALEDLLEALDVVNITHILNLLNVFFLFIYLIYTEIKSEIFFFFQFYWNFLA